jgi:hypothetical protein
LPHTFGFVYLWRIFPNFSSGRHTFCMENELYTSKSGQGVANLL